MAPYCIGDCYRRKVKYLVSTLVSSIYTRLLYAESRRRKRLRGPDSGMIKFPGQRKQRMEDKAAWRTLLSSCSSQGTGNCMHIQSLGGLGLILNIKYQISSILDIVVHSRRAVEQVLPSLPRHPDSYGQPGGHAEAGSARTGGSTIPQYRNPTNPCRLVKLYKGEMIDEMQRYRKRRR